MRYCPAQLQPHVCHYCGACLCAMESLSTSMRIYSAVILVHANNRAELQGASEVRAAFLPAVVRTRKAQLGLVGEGTEIFSG
jgi:polyferredoxin